MNQYRTVRIGNNPLLVIGCAALAFGVTHFYFNQGDAGTLASLFGHIMLAPLYVLSQALHVLGLPSLAGKVTIIFAVLFLTYTVLALFLFKLYEVLAWRKQNQASR